MDYSETIQFLLEHAGPSIVYRTRKEILGEAPDTPCMTELRKQILVDQGVQHIFSLQKEDGWLGGLFHGEEEPESGIRYLREKGLESDQPVILRALEAIEMRGNSFDAGSLVRVGKRLDEFHLGGSQMIKACVYAYAGYEEEPFIQEQIEEALSAFQYVAEHHKIEDVYTQYKAKFIFKDNVRWPSIYHLRLLAYTYSWRNTEKLDILAAAFNKLVRWSPMPEIKLLHKSQVIAPASVFMNDFDLDLDHMEAKDWMMWFHRTEMIARLGIADKVAAINGQIHTLKNILSDSNGLFINALSHFYFHRWTSYTGLALENDWKVKEARICDLTFRSILILKLAGKLNL